MAVLLCLVAMAGCGREPEATPTPASPAAAFQAAAPKVQTARVTRRALRDSLQRVATAAAGETVKISSPVSARIEAVRVQMGDEVSRGQVWGHR